MSTITVKGVEFDAEQARKCAEDPRYTLPERAFLAAVGYGWSATRKAVIPAPQLRAILADGSGYWASGSRQRKAVREAVALGLLAEGSKDGALILPPAEGVA